MQALNGVLVDYILHITSPPSPNFTLLSSIIPHIHALTTAYPVESAKQFLAKLKLMQKNLTKGLSRGATSPESRTWPGPSELAVLWTISHIWPTSDMNHHVISPARLLMGSYLGLGRIRSLQDVCSALFLCTLFLRYEQFSKRFVPETINVVLNAILHLSPHRFKDATSVPGAFPCPDLNSDLCRPLRLSKKHAKTLEPNPPVLPALLSSKLGEKTEVEQRKVDLLAVALDLLGRFGDIYKSLEGFIELYEPALEILEGLQLEGASSGLQVCLSAPHSYQSS